MRQHFSQAHPLLFLFKILKELSTFTVFDHSPPPFCPKPTSANFILHNASTTALAKVVDDLCVAPFNHIFSDFIVLELAAWFDTVDFYLLFETNFSLGFQVTMVS